MNFFIGLVFLILNADLSRGKSFRIEHNEDTNYWHTYNIKYLNNILKTCPTTKFSSQGVDAIAKNVILFIGDGMSFATIAAGRVLKGQLQGKSGEETELVFERFPHLSLAKTYNTDSQVPDSAGTATALFSGIKTKIRVLGLPEMPDLSKCRETDRLKTLIDWAQEKGKRTGIVTTTRITHATPAAAYSYSPTRDFECDTLVSDNFKIKGFKDIARQLLENAPGNKLNVIFGGGRDFFGASIDGIEEKIKFAGRGELSCNRTDGKNLVSEFLKRTKDLRNVKYVTNNGELVDIDYEEIDQVLGLFANNHMSYESLRDTTSEGEPSLMEMTKAAIKILNNKKNKKGYVLIVEGGKIDQAHHQNHARLAIEEFIEFERAIEYAYNATLSEETMIVVTSDHSHSMIYNGYAKRGNDIFEFANKVNGLLYETLTYATGPGYSYHKNINKSLENLSSEIRKQPLYMHQSLIPLPDAVHAGEDVPVYSSGPNSFLLQKVFEQNYIPYAISFSACIGPLATMNPSCSRLNSAGKRDSNEKSLLLILIMIPVILF